MLYNSLTDELAILDPHIKDIYEMDSVSSIEKTYPEFYNFLVKKKFLIHDKDIEYRKCIEQWERHDNDVTRFSLTVNPTLDCNMRCWYCYESHKQSSIMSDEVILRIHKLIKKKMENELLKTFDLTFFGGEPLMQYTKVVKPLIDFTKSMADSHDKELKLHFTTNAYLLSEHIIKELATTDCNISFQITLDGNETIHDQTRHTRNNEGSYSVILDNCRMLLAHSNMNVTLRCNYTIANAASFIDLADDLEKHGIMPTSSMRVYFKRVWQDHGQNEEVINQITKAHDFLEKKGYSVDDLHATDYQRCYAESPNCLVVNYNGDLFRCTARDFSSENAEGIINEYGDTLFNDKNTRRNATKWGNETCFQCIIYPICHGMCSQHKFENYRPVGCLAGQTERMKQAVLEEKVKQIIKRSKQLQSHNY